MAVSDFISANGKSVRVSVERKTESEVFGRDLVSGGLRDFFSKSKEGYWIVGKCEQAYPSNLANLIREVLKSQLGTYPFVMPETAASHIVVALWEGKPPIDEENLLSGVVRSLSQSNIVQDAELVKKIRTPESKIQELLDSSPSKREGFDKASYDDYRKRMENERNLSRKPGAKPSKKRRWWNRMSSGGSPSEPVGYGCVKCGKKAKTLIQCKFCLGLYCPDHLYASLHGCNYGRRNKKQYLPQFDARHPPPDKLGA